MPLAFDMTPSRQGEVHSNPWFSSINALAAAMFDRPYDLAVNAYVSSSVCGEWESRVLKYFLQIRGPHDSCKKCGRYPQVL